MKSRWSLLIALVVIASMLLGACAQATPAPAVVEPTKAADPTQAPAATDAPTAAPTAKVEPVTITYWDWFKDQSPAFDQAIAEFEAAYPNIKIKRELPATEMGEALNLANQSGNMPDVFLVPTDNVIAIKEQIDQGWMRPLNDLPGFDEWLKTFPEWETVRVEGNNTFDGKTYTLPNNVNSPWVVMFVNTGLYKQAGLRVPEDLPKTWDQVLANSRVIKEKTGRFGFNLGGKDAWYAGISFWACNLSNGLGYVMQGYGFDPRLGRYDAQNNGCIKSVIKGILQARDEGLIPPDAVSVGVDQVQNDFPTQNGAAHIFTGSWVVSGCRTSNPEFTDFTALPLPTFGTDKQGGYFYFSPGGRYLAISPTSQHPNEAFEFVKWIYGPSFGKAMAETGNGVTLFTPKPWDSYAKTDAERNMLNMDVLSIPGPDPLLRNPAFSNVKASAQGDDLNAMIIGFYVNQLKLEDLDKLLVDYDARFNAGLEQAVKDAQAAGAKVSMDDLKFSDWDPMKAYINK